MALPSSRLTLVGAFLLGAVLGALGVTGLHHGSSGLVHAQPAPAAACSNATLSGSYGVLVQGYTLLGADGAPLAAPVPRAAINLVTADGAGNISRTGTVNNGGTIGPNTASGTYTVNSDCTFTVTYTSPMPAHVAGVLVNGGARAFVVSADPNPLVANTWERQ